MRISPVVLTGTLLILLTACGGGANETREQSTTSPPNVTEAPVTTSPGNTTEGTTAPVQPNAPPVASTGTAPSSPVATDTIEVKMGTDNGQLKYEPANITVRPGTKIRWVMNKAGPHNVVFVADGSPDPASAQTMDQKKLLSKAGDFYVTTVPTAQPGKYSFYCTPHRSAGMVGTLTMVGTATTAPQQ
ncbi:plastocyanin [Candidatus Cyanaurora vandensis]|uniref:plastocyanin n=1 Tax=Candidatus Cyanaurora vandensis TaxID=2714958 RepID=UPI00257FF519|nr:plastocyanin [Candidatus Cyanaurora vandensis]